MLFKLPSDANTSSVARDIMPSNLELIENMQE